jgi:hypothetical protein
MTAALAASRTAARAWPAGWVRAAAPARRPPRAAWLVEARGRFQRLAAIDASLAACAAALAAASAPATALALLMLSIGAAEEAIALTGALAAVSTVGVTTSSFLVQPPSANCEARAAARARDNGIERFMTDSWEGVC